jgi:hypothetical protein
LVAIWSMHLVSSMIPSLILALNPALLLVKEELLVLGEEQVASLPTWEQVFWLGNSVILLLMADVLSTIIAAWKAHKAEQAAIDLQTGFHSDIKEKLENGIADKLRVILALHFKEQKDRKDAGGEKKP